jgi:hypothetical protein
VASAILVELNIRLTVLVVETARLERRGVNDRIVCDDSNCCKCDFIDHKENVVMMSYVFGDKNDVIGIFLEFTFSLSFPCMWGLLLCGSIFYENERAYSGSVDLVIRRRSNIVRDGTHHKALSVEGATTFNRTTFSRMEFSILFTVLLSQFSECHSSECHSSECHSSECHSSECHSSECHSSECHFDNYHSVECHFREHYLQGKAQLCGSLH